MDSHIDVIKGLYRYRSMIKHLTKIELAGRYRGSVLGFIWVMINPAMQILVYTFVFTIVVPVNIPKYPIYLLAALLPWIFFQTSVQIGTTSVIKHTNLVTKIYFPRQILPFYIVVANAVNFFLSLSMLVLAKFLLGSPFTWAIAWFPVVFLLQTVMVFGMTLLVSALNVYFRDIEHIVGVVLQVWFYFTPIIYSVKSVPKRWAPLLNANPLKGLIDAYSAIFYHGTPPSLLDLIYPVTFALLVFGAGWVIFRRLSYRFAEVL